MLSKKQLTWNTKSTYIPHEVLSQVQLHLLVYRGFCSSFSAVEREVRMFSIDSRHWVFKMDYKVVITESHTWCSPTSIQLEDSSNSHEEVIDEQYLFRKALNVRIAISECSSSKVLRKHVREPRTSKQDKRWLGSWYFFTVQYQLLFCRFTLSALLQTRIVCSQPVDISQPRNYIYVHRQQRNFSSDVQSEGTLHTWHLLSQTKLWMVHN